VAGASFDRPLVVVAFDAGAVVEGQLGGVEAVEVVGPVEFAVEEVLGELEFIPAGWPGIGACSLLLAVLGSELADDILQVRFAE